MNKKVLALCVASALSLLSVDNAKAAGFALYEQGASGLGHAFAGAAAVAEDATTVWWNPAGMSRLGMGKRLAIAGSLIVPSTEFSDSASVAATGRPLGGNGGNAGDAAIVPTLFYVMDVAPRWHFGVGVTVPFGLKTEYDPDWLGRFQGIMSEVKTININPSVSYQVSPTMSVGAGINYQWAEIETLTGVNLVAAEAQNLSKVDGSALGFNAGVLFDMAALGRVGIHYRSSLDHELEGDTSFTAGPLPNGAVKLEVKTPESLAFSIARRMNPEWELLVDATWWRWSRIQQVPLVRTDGPLAGQPVSTFVFNFDDTWRLSVGGKYRPGGGPWTWKFGVAYDQTPVPNAESRTVRLPDSDRYWFSLGAKYQPAPNSAFDVGYTFVKARDANINNDQSAPPVRAGIVNGSYEAHVHILGIQYQHTF